MLLVKFVRSQLERKVTQKMTMLIDMNMKKALVLAAAADKAAVVGHPLRHQATGQTMPILQQQHEDSTDR